MKLLLFLLVPCNVLFGQHGKGEKFYEGTIHDKHGMRATFRVDQTLRNDSIVWSYFILHDGDTTIYDIKYAADDKLKRVNYNGGDDYAVSDSIHFTQEVVYVYDVYDTHDDGTKFVGGFFFISETYGLLSIGGCFSVDYLKVEGHQNHETFIQPYIADRCAH